MRKAIFDIGTNSIKLLIYSSINGELKILFDKGTITQLGGNLWSTNSISNAAINRNISALANLLKLCEKYEVNEIKAVGTMCLRSANNRQEFLDAVQAQLNLKIVVISGKREAEISTLAATESLHLASNKNVIFDIGGGSTEIILPANDFSMSLNIGALQATEKFLKSDPFTLDEFRDLCDYLHDLLSDRIPKSKIDNIIGIGGTITTLGAISLQLSEYNTDKIQGLRLSKQTINTEVKLFRSKTISERKKIIGLHPDRAKPIPGGSAIVLAILQYFGKSEILICDYGLRHGLMYQDK